VSHEDSIFGPNNTDDDNFALPPTVEPFLEDKDPKNNLNTDGIALWWALNLWLSFGPHEESTQDVLLMKN
jgi:pre-mRNA-processing factor 8